MWLRCLEGVYVRQASAFCRGPLIPEHVVVMVKHVDSLDAEGTDQMPKLGVDAVEPLVQAQVGNHGASRAGQVLGSRRYVLADDRNEVQCFDLISELCPAGWHFSLAQGVVAPAGDELLDGNFGERLPRTLPVVLLGLCELHAPDRLGLAQEAALISDHSAVVRLGAALYQSSLLFQLECGYELLLRVPEERSSLQASDEKEGAEARELIDQAGEPGSRDVHAPGAVRLRISRGLVSTLGDVIVTGVDAQQDLVVAEEAALW